MRWARAALDASINSPDEVGSGLAYHAMPHRATWPTASTEPLTRTTLPRRIRPTMPSVSSRVHPHIEIQQPGAGNRSLGIDSTGVLVRWLTDPSSRNFPLSALTVLVSQLGDEYPDTYRNVDIGKCGY
jgi:hypothetical protein